ncbi:nanos homolog 1 [Denticeps clupeoides]|uniref:Nanos-type domain-containing protein n=1 Tax=Denticeps clupeoides TaxID=299321 RepID=A0AAY4CM06_9TELE|nr:nanos homolog 1-like [Denticeps clupeoides]
MDFLNHNYSYDYTFNFWNDYLGLSTLVTQSSRHGAPPPSPNSITESLKATLGLCGEGAAPSASPPPTSILELKERFSILSPFRGAPCAAAPPPDRDPAFGGGFAAFDLFGAERRARKPACRAKQEPKICVFCRNNGAPEEVFGSHVLKAPDGRVVCPILRAYTCPLCSANGDNAHTIKYCPLSKDPGAGQRPIKGGRAVGGKRMKMF